MFSVQLLKFFCFRLNEMEIDHSQNVGCKWNEFIFQIEIIECNTVTHEKYVTNLHIHQNTSVFSILNIKYI